MTQGTIYLELNLQNLAGASRGVTITVSRVNGLSRDIAECRLLVRNAGTQCGYLPIMDYIGCISSDGWENGVYAVLGLMAANGRHTPKANMLPPSKERFAFLESSALGLLSIKGCLVSSLYHIWTAISMVESSSCSICDARNSIVTG